MTITSNAIAPADLQHIAKLVLDASAIVLDESKAYLIEARLNPLVRALEMGSIGELVSRSKLHAQADLRNAIVDAMTTNETSFFRDIHPFNALKDQVLPELIKARQTTKRLTIWSNACSSGQEPYTIAMLLREHFPELTNWNVTIHATDISNTVLERAKSGLFNQTEVNRGLPMQLLMKHFKRDGMLWKINDDIRRMIRFQNVNLIESWPREYSSVDIVFLRNVLIYFCPATKTQILNRVHSVLPKDGCLFLGGSESMMNICDRFDRNPIGKAVCYSPKQ